MGSYGTGTHVTRRAGLYCEHSPGLLDRLARMMVMVSVLHDGAVNQGRSTEGRYSAHGRGAGRDWAVLACCGRVEAAGCCVCLTRASSPTPALFFSGSGRPLRNPREPPDEVVRESGEGVRQQYQFSYWERARGYAALVAAPRARAHGSADPWVGIRWRTSATLSLAKRGA